MSSIDYSTPLLRDFKLAYKSLCLQKDEKMPGHVLCSLSAYENAT